MIKVAVGILQDGGKIEDGESPAECLKRELNEELGVDVEIGELYHRQHYTYPDSGSFDVFYYIISAYGSPVKNRAFKQIRWVAEHELTSLDMLEGNEEVVELLSRVK